VLTAVGVGGAQLWLKVCRANCQSAVLDMAAVPYFVHSQDLKKIAPLWKEYVLIVRSSTIARFPPLAPRIDPGGACLRPATGRRSWYGMLSSAWARL
jgi:hypothetical protein